MYPLSSAVSKGSSPAIVRALYEAWPGSVRAHNGWCNGPALHALGERTPFETVEFLVGVYPKAVRHRAAFNNLPIHHGIERLTDVRSLRLLVERYPESLLAANDAGLLPIHLAVCREYEELEELVEFLASRCPESLLATCTDRQLPLHMALRSGAGVRIIRRLAVEAIPEGTKLGLMHVAVRAAVYLTQGLRLDDVPEHLLENVNAVHEAAPLSLRATDAAGSLPIHFAVVQQSLNLVSRLVSFDPETLLIPNAAGELPFHLGLERGPLRWDVADVLFEGAPQVALMAGRRGTLPIYRALDLRWFGLVKSIARLCPEGCRQRGARRRTPLHFAATLQHLDQDREQLVDAADALIRCWPDSLLEVDVDGNVPIHVALKCFDGDAAYEFVRLLMDRSPDSLQVAGADGMLPLHVAVSQRSASPRLVQLLVDGWNEALDVRDASGNIPLLRAVSNWSAPLDVIYVLLRAKPDILRS